MSFSAISVLRLNRCSLPELSEEYARSLQISTGFSKFYFRFGLAASPSIWVIPSVDSAASS